LGFFVLSRAFPGLLLMIKHEEELDEIHIILFFISVYILDWVPFILLFF
jgi:hypothetical protein